jgi:hypothetical protein
VTGEQPLRARLQAALEAPDPLGRLEAIVAAERARELRVVAEHVRNVGRRCHGSPGDRHRRRTANACAELLIRRNREIARTAVEATARAGRAQTTDTTREAR